MAAAGYHLTEIHYRDLYGHLLWRTPMLFKRLHGLGEELMWAGQRWMVRRVAVADQVQHVNLEPGAAEGAR